MKFFDRLLNSATIQPRVVSVFIGLFLTGISFSQNVLVLDVYKPWGFKRIHYYTQQDVSVKIKELTYTFKGKLAAIHDSTIFIFGKDGLDSIHISDVRMILADRSNYVTRSFSKFFRWAGIGFIGLDAFNNIITGTPQIFKPKVIVIGVALYIPGWLLKSYGTKRYRINKNRVLRVINTSPF